MVDKFNTSVLSGDDTRLVNNVTSVDEHRLCQVSTNDF